MTLEEIKEIQDRVLEDNAHFANINPVSLSTIDHVLNEHQLRMKRVYCVPFESNSDRVKE